MPRKIPNTEPPDPGGRPTKLTIQLIEDLCALLRGGVSLESASAILEINPSTLRQWRQRGRGEQKDRPGKKLHELLNTRIEQALGQAEDDLMRHMFEQAESDWRAAAWWLERRMPETYSLTHRVRVEESQDPVEMTDAQLFEFVSGVIGGNREGDDDEPE